MICQLLKLMKETDPVILFVRKKRCGKETLASNRFLSIPAVQKKSTFFAVLPNQSIYTSSS